MNTRKNTNKKPAGLTNFQKYLTLPRPALQ